ncbi:phage protein [Aquabacter sp. CN5-332]|uniref:phage structural protein n=1 Tax=Aquabacter sp. CN5-332 TaxID=3156608 RepID=UPI0032B4108B
MPTACLPLTVYSFQNVVLTIDGREVTGVWEGDDAIQVERHADLGTPVVGADGSPILSITADQSATLTLKLQPTSAWNRYLSQKVKKMRAGAVVDVMTIGLRDTGTGEGGGCSSAVIMKEPPLSLGTSATEREWAIYCGCWQENDIQYTDVSAI